MSDLVVHGIPGITATLELRKRYDDLRFSRSV